MEDRVPVESAVSQVPKLKRYNLALPEELFEEVQQVADAHGLTVVSLLRHFIKLGLLAVKIEEDPNATLIIRDNDTERQLLLLV